MTAALLLLAVGLIAANGFFVGAEFAVLASRRARLEPLLGSSRRARAARPGSRRRSVPTLTEATAAWSAFLSPSSP